MCQILFLKKLQALGLKNETLEQTLSCEFCEISKNTFLTEHLRTTASEYSHYKMKYLLSLLCEVVQTSDCF